MWRSPRVEAYKEREADEARQLELDSVEEARVNALTQSARYLQGVRRYHDRNIQQRSFNIGDLVLRRIQDETGLDKLNSRWEGPFIVTKVTRPGSSSTCASFILDPSSLGVSVDFLKKVRILIGISTTLKTI